MEPTKEELEKILASLTPGEWVNPHIFSWDEESRIVYTLVATKPESGMMYYYDTDSREFEPLNLPTGRSG
jgi:hypothetical protein